MLLYLSLGVLALLLYAFGTFARRALIIAGETVIDLEQSRASLNERTNRAKAQAEINISDKRSEEQALISECAQLLSNARTQLAEKFAKDTCIDREAPQLGKSDFDSAWRHVQNLADAKYGSNIVYLAKTEIHLI